MTAPDARTVIAELLTDWLVDNWFDFEGRMPGGYPDIDGVATHLADVLATDPRIAIVDTANAKPTPADQRDDAALSYWPRIQAAIRGAAVGRADMDYLTPECHRKNCKQCGISNPSDLGQAFGQMKHRISEAILDELCSGYYSDPDDHAAGGES